MSAPIMDEEDAWRAEIAKALRRESELRDALRDLLEVIEPFEDTVEHDNEGCTLEGSCALCVARKLVYERNRKSDEETDGP